jgi:hypothetical protein
MKLLIFALVLCATQAPSLYAQDEDAQMLGTEIELVNVSVYRSPTNFGVDLTAYDPFIAEYFHLALMYGMDNALWFDPYIHLGLGAMPFYSPFPITLGLEYAQPLRLGVKYLGRIQLTSHLVVLEGEDVGLHLIVRGLRDLQLGEYSIQAGIGMSLIDRYDLDM